VPQPKVSALVNYWLDGFSVEKLMDFIVALGRDVEIVVRPKRDTSARELVLEEAQLKAVFDALPTITLHAPSTWPRSRTPAQTKVQFGDDGAGGDGSVDKLQWRVLYPRNSPKPAAGRMLRARARHDYTDLVKEPLASFSP
jgi:Helix-turn-helix domain